MSCGRTVPAYGKVYSSGRVFWLLPYFCLGQEKHHLWFYRGLTVVEEVLLDARDVYWRHTLIM